MIDTGGLCMTRGPQLTPEEQAQRRDKIFGIALRLFEENGFQKTSIREIAKAADMGTSTLYWYFNTKDEIAVYALEQIITEATEIARSIAADEPNHKQCLHKIMRSHLAYVKEYKSILTWLYTEICYLDAEYKKRLQAVRHAYRDVLVSVLDDGISSGVFRRTDTMLVARLLVNSMLSIAFTSEPSSSLDAMLEESTRIILQGITG
jgi:AcrR family transcriptional regulator